MREKRCGRFTHLSRTSRRMLARARRILCQPVGRTDDSLEDVIHRQQAPRASRRRAKNAVEDTAEVLTIFRWINGTCDKRTCL